MPDIIQLLPDALANQIAAGEVVQRPASVVKELLENAIDAKATTIKLIVKEAGKTLIQVIDNGIGMSTTDARMSLERHATSKIKTSDDLFAIRTMGFRGEAMASIAAVAKVEIKTKKKETELGSLLQVEASEVVLQEPIATETGTSVSVKNLFYNVPARRNFLKSNSVEMRHIIDEFNRIALSNPQIQFLLYQNDQKVTELPKGKLSHRIVNLFGKNYQTQLAACEEITDHLTVKGYIGKPEAAKKTRGEQFFFVNNRFIKSNYLNHSVTNAFEGLLQDRSFPFYVLFITIDPKHIDINVHPTKTEIKFDDERTVYAIVKAAVKQALGTHNLSPSLDFGNDVNFASPISIKVNNPSTTSTERDYSQFKSSPLQKRNIDKWETAYEELETDRLSIDELRGEEKTITFESSATDATTKPIKESGIVFQLHGRYLVSQVKSGMMLVDQQAAHERILYEKYLNYVESNSGASQQCLFPQTVTFALADFTLVMEMKLEIEGLGFKFEEFGKDSVVINGIPADMASGNEKSLFEGLIEQYKWNKAELSLSKKENLARSLAKRSAVKIEKRLQPEEMNSIIDQLFACSNPNYTPDGISTFVVLGIDQIDNFFNR
ncbi:MAG: DNA mismatch repair endonuclease MutL [Cyclobacteriaceae bacterium]|nr:DNA mismatch repair endonuclease MutL [Cyclobacteriaceae bacterium]